MPTYVTGNGDDTIVASDNNDLIRSNGGNDTIRGRRGNDVIYAGDGDDFIDGGDGDDTIYAEAGNDEVVGGNGHDTIRAGSGNDTVSGGSGNDVIYAGDGDDFIDGGSGHDVIYAEEGDDEILGGSGDDTIRAGAGNDTVSGGIGNDVIYAGDGHDFVDGGDGRDVIYAEAGNDEVLGGKGDDTIRGGSGDDVLAGGDDDDDIDGGSDFDIIDGGSGNDRLFGGSHFDVITAGTGKDLVYGGSHSDVIFAGDGSIGDRLYGDGYDSLDDFLAGRPVTTEFGNDNVEGGAGNDVIYGDSGLNGAAGGDDYLLGGAGDDTIFGEGGSDIVDGGEGRDTLSGGRGDDFVIGGAGADVLTGGAGRDLFTLFDASESSPLATDRITDFVRGEDRIDFLAMLGQKLAWGGTTATSRGVWYLHASGRTFVFASMNGDTVPEIRITLDGLHNLTPTDFWGVVGDKPPEIFGDTNFVFEDDASPAAGDVLANDVGENLHVTAVSFGTTTGTVGAPLQGQYGSLVLDASGGYTYTLDSSLAAIQALGAGQSVFETFTYSAADAGGSASATLGIQIIGRNDAPTASAAAVVTNENTVVSGSLPAATDVEGNAFAYRLGAQATNGTAVVNADGSFNYTPNAGFNGTDSFTFIVDDGLFEGSNEYTVSVTVVETNEAPFVANYGVPAGIVHTPIGSGTSSDTAAGLIIQADGKLLMVGQSTSLSTNQDIALARYNADGTFDTTFGNNGVVITPVGFSFTTDLGNAVAVQPDGKILVAGLSNGDFALLRYNADGTLDHTFGGGDGIVSTPIAAGTGTDQALHLTLHDGKIVLVGTTQPAFIPSIPPGPVPQPDVAVVRYNSDGSLDTTFGGGDGIVITPIGDSFDAAVAVLALPGGGLLVAANTITTTTSQDFALLRYTPTGELDTTFGGGDGIVTTPVAPGNAFDSARSIVQQPDGRIVIVGQSGGNGDFGLVRYNADGTLDTSFGTGGKVLTAITPTSFDAATGVALQADGKLLVGGWTISNNSDFAIVRYNTDGTVDTTFGVNGVVLTNIGTVIPAIGPPQGTQDTAVTIAVQPDGKIVLGGYASATPSGTHSDFALARYNADGSLDATFRAEERLVATEGTDFSHTVPADRFADPDGDVLTYSAVQSNGNALPGWLTFDAATRTLSGQPPPGSADVHVRITATDPGGLSASYAYWIYTNSAPVAVGASGIVATNASAPNFASDQSLAVTLQSDGKILTAGLANFPGLDTAVARYNADGSLDLTFGGGDGIARINTNPGNGTDTGRSILVQADGRIVVAGATTTVAGGNDIALTRLNADGSLDTSFGGGDGIVQTSIAAGTGNDSGASVVLQSDGKLLVAGTTTAAAGGTELVLVRYNTDGSLDTTFDGDGFAIAGLNANPDEGFSVKTQSDGKIVVAGYGTTGPNQQVILVARFNANGSLDTSFAGTGIATADIGVFVGPPPPPIPGLVFEAGQGLVIQPDGRILVAGFGPTAGGGQDIALVRFNADGSLDTTFGAGGIVTTNASAGTFADRAAAIALQADGRIVVAGAVVTTEGAADVAVLRYLSDGTLDTTFGEDGIVTTAVGPGQAGDQALGVVIQPDGRIVITGLTFFGGTTTDFALVRYNPDGSLDTTFRGLGNPSAEVGKPFTWTVPPHAFTDADNDALTYSFTLENGLPLPAWLTVNGAALSGTPPAGTADLALRVTATDQWGASASHTFVIDIVNPNAAPFVANYGVPAGIVHTPIGAGQSNDAATGMVIQPDGKILLAGSSSPLATGQDFSLARYNADGSFDTTFGNRGVVITPVSFATTADTGTSVALQADGKVVVAGWTITGNGADFALVRYNANGTLDTTFGGGDGIVTTPIGTGAAADQALHVTVQSDGKIVVVGFTQPPAGPIPPNSDIAIVRYNTDGSLDTTFDGDGIVITAVSPIAGPDAAQGVLVQPDGGILVAGFTFLAGTAQDFALVRYTATGQLDLTFGGGDGVVTTAVVPNADSARGILQQADGRIVIAGVAFAVPGSLFALARYNADGSPDMTFGTNGIVTTAIGVGASSGTSVAQQADGKLLVAGSTTANGSDFAIVRYNQNGSVDTTFGTNGVVVTSIAPGTSPDSAFTISVQADGKIVVGGNGFSPTGLFDFALARYNPDGSLDGTFRAEQRLVATEGAAFSHTVPADRFADPDGDALTYSAAQSDGSALPGWLTFNAATRTFSGTAPSGSADAHVRVTATDPSGLSASYIYWIYTNSPPTSGGTGFVTTNVSSPASLQDQANGVALQADGKIVAVGLTTGPSPALTDLAVVRYTADGSIDLSFGGGDGIVTINTNPVPGTETARGVVIQPDGRILVAGTTTGSGSGTDIVLTRLNPDGTRDTTFGGGDGIVTTPISAGSDTGNAITLQANGKILVSGMSGGELLLVRYNTDGSLDATFDLDGFATAGFGPANDEGLSVKTQPDGKIVVAGYASIGAGTMFLVARFNADGSRDMGFGAGGLVTTDITAGPTPIPPFQEAGQALAILPDGRILVVGQAPTATSPSDIALVRYLSNGSLDTSFGGGDGIVTTAAGLAQETGFAVALQPDGRIVVAGGNFTATGGPDIAVLRYNADGTLDTTFGGTGIVTTAIANGLGGDQALSVTLQPDGRIVIGGLSLSPSGGTTDFTLVRFNSDGSLDTTFGGIGNPTVEVGEAFAWTIPPRTFNDADTDALTYTITMADGTPLPGWLTFSGMTLSGTPPVGATDLDLHVTATDVWGAAATQLLRLNVEDLNGAPVVNHVAPAGIVTTPITPGADLAGDLVVQPDGKIVLVGQSSSPGTSQDFTLVRYNVDGSLDTTFGGDGIVTAPINAGIASDIANGVALQSDGKILVAGWGSGTGGADFALARYNPDGTFDTTFGGGDGIVTTAVAPGSSRDEAFRVTVQGDGKIVVAGFAQDTTTFPAPPSNFFGAMAVVRYNADGSLDTTFGGGDGIVTTDIVPGQPADVAQAVLVQPDGRIVVAGYTNLTPTGTSQDFALIRYTADGELDLSFGEGDGIVTTPVAPPGSADSARAIVQLPDGRFVVAGQAAQTGASGSAPDFALARYSADGVLDTTFGTAGIVTTPLVGIDAATGIVRLADGKLLVGGWSLTVGNSSFAIVRYNENGSLDTTFGAGGIVLTNLEPGAAQAVGIAMSADGKIVVGGVDAATVNGPSDFAVVRYNADGSLDATFRAEERVAATEGGPFEYTVPADRFVDPDGDVLSYSAAQSDGSALPGWLAFDAASRTFSGTAPAGSPDVHVRVTATDPAELSASYGYWIYVNTAPSALAPSGIVTTHVALSESAAAVAVQADGKIVLTGSGLLNTQDTPVLRYNADGSLDLTFVGDGIAAVSTSSVLPEQGRAIAVQPDGRIVVASNSGTDIAVSRLTADGFQDGSFGGGDGIVTTSISAGVDTVASIALQSDGRILVAGRTSSAAGDFELMLVRYNADGSLDTTFGGGDGVAIPGFNANNDEALSVKTQPDGKIVVSGYSASAPLEQAFLVTRFNLDGSLDTTFDGDGIVTTDIGPGTGFPPGTSLTPAIPLEAGHSLTIQPDGRIVVVGYGPTTAGGQDIALVRYDADGSLDTTFGTGGIVTTAVSAGTISDRGLGVALQADGHIVVGAFVLTTEGGGDFAVLRYDGNGSLDTTFGGGDGIATIPISPATSPDLLNGLAIQADGRIVVVGSTLLGASGSDVAAVRLNSGGSLDTSFGGVGAPVVNPGEAFSWTVQRFFTDADSDNLTYTMTRADGSPLPDGLTFTGTTLNGTVPTGTGELALRLTAADPSGAEASQYFVLHVNDPLAPVDGDTFTFDDGFGSAVVSGFTAGDASGDVLDLSALTNPDWTDFADIVALTTQVGDNAVIDLGNGNTITLVGVTASSLTADDFNL